MDSSAQLGENTANAETYSKIQHHKICFGVFCSVSSPYIIKYPQYGEELSYVTQSAFRILSLTKPENTVILQMILKSEGFKSYDELAFRISDFFYAMRKNAPIEADGQTKTYLAMTLKDFRCIVKIARNTRDKEWTAFQIDEDTNNQTKKEIERMVNRKTKEQILE
jgi:type VI protein secretion system component Hcp